MGFPKALLEIEGRTFVAHTAESMLSAMDRLIVVVGAYADRVRRAMPADARITVTENRDYQRGQLSSIKSGLRAVSANADGVVIHLTDHPIVKPETFFRLAQAYDRHSAPILIARNRGRRGHPVLFAHALLGELMAAPENEGARSVVNSNPDRVVYVDVDDAGVTLDLDTPDDLARAGLALPPHSRKLAN